MGLVCVVRFSVLIEAQIARSALESAGILAFVADEYYGYADWPLQTALQGFRLQVPVEAFDDAVGVLLEAGRTGAADMADTPSDIPSRPRTAEWILLGFVPGLLVPEIGFAVEATRLKPTLARKTFLWMFYGVMLFQLISLIIIFSRS